MLVVSHFNLYHTQASWKKKPHRIFVQVVKFNGSRFKATATGQEVGQLLFCSIKRPPAEENLAFGICKYSKINRRSERISWYFTEKVSAVHIVQGLFKICKLCDRRQILFVVKIIVYKSLRPRTPRLHQNNNFTPTGMVAIFPPGFAIFPPRFAIFPPRFAIFPPRFAIFLKPRNSRIVVRGRFRGHWSIRKILLLEIIENSSSSSLPGLGFPPYFSTFYKLY